MLKKLFPILIATALINPIDNHASRPKIIFADLKKNIHFKKADTHAKMISSHCKCKT